MTATTCPRRVPASSKAVWSRVNSATRPVKGVRPVVAAASRHVRTRARQLIHFDRDAQSLDWEWTEPLGLDIAFGRAPAISRNQSRPGHCHLLHPRCEVRRLSDRGVVHVEVAPNGPHDDFPGVQSDTHMNRNAFPRRIDHDKASRRSLGPARARGQDNQDGH
jgi:hypothetical protein